MNNSKVPNKVLIAGGAGFIGTNLAAHYLKQGSQVTVYDNLSRPGVDTNLNWLKSQFRSDKLSIVIDDILNTKSLTRSVKNQDYIIHQAGQTAVTTSLTDPVKDFEVNARGTLNLLEAIRIYNPSALVIFASTNKVYGDLIDLRTKETDTRHKLMDHKASISESRPLDFHSPYGCSKGVADQYMLDYARSYGLNTVVFRQSCIYGEHQLGVEDQGWLAHFASQIIKGNQITIFGTGKQVRDILYIRDLVKAYQLVWEDKDKAIGKAFNIGGGVNSTVSLIEAIELLEKAIGKKAKHKFTDQRVGDQKYYVSDITKAKDSLNWHPETTIQEGIRCLTNWLKNL